MAKSAPIVPKRPRSRLVRDPIHEDIRLSALEAAVIDTRVFQRLRYIRQNGLLHFVFPGAVHTRFAHSIGTMAMAERAFARFASLLESDSKQNASLNYVNAIFRLGALLHDVGHCAFSHSSEQVKIGGRPLFGTLRQCLTEWKEEELLGQLQAVFPKRLDQGAMHEELGLALVHHLFRKGKVVELCQQELQTNAKTVATDVCAMMSGGLPFSKVWRTSADGVFTLYKTAHSRGRVYGRVNRGDFASGLMEVLHALVSGTMDVDRMDYLLRDSYYCGVPYGCCDVAMLISNLSLGGVRGKLDLFLNRKAVDALDDLLWSRYQLFVQVLNHKANVALNKMLSLAIEEGIGEAHIEHPKTRDQYLLFTDDYVMSSVRRACTMGNALDHKNYAKALVDRKLPLHLGAIDEPNTVREQETALAERAKAAGVAADKVFVGRAEAVLIKPGRTPSILDWNRAERRYDLHQFAEFSHFTKRGAPSSKRVLHFYVDRAVLAGA